MFIDAAITILPIIVASALGFIAANRLILIHSIKNKISLLLRIILLFSLIAILISFSIFVLSLLNFSNKCGGWLGETYYCNLYEFVKEQKIWLFLNFLMLFTSTTLWGLLTFFAVLLYKKIWCAVKNR